jgi:ion channel-forming bestrophin family protein
MREYQITEWVKTTFSYKSTVLPMIIWRVMIFPLFTTLLLSMRDGYLGENLAHLPWASLWIPSLGHTLIGSALGLVLVFRNNASYDRFWEGRKQWGGIVNASRNLARQARSYGGDLSSLAPLITAFPLALKHQLRSESSDEAILRFLGSANNRLIQLHKNPSLAINFAMSNWIHRMSQKERITDLQAHRMEEQVGKLMDCQGACERILNTPVPFAHAIHVKQLLFIYLLSLPLVLIPIVGWVSVLIILVIAFGLLGIEEAGIEIEDPFGHDPNDLPLSNICQVIERDVQSMMYFDDETSKETEVKFSSLDESIADEDGLFSIF